MLLSDDIELVAIATILAQMRSLAAVTQYVIFHCRATNTFAAVEGAGEEDETTFPY